MNCLNQLTFLKRLQSIRRYNFGFFGLSVAISFSFLGGSWAFATLYVWSVLGLCPEFKAYIGLGVVAVGVGGLGLIFHGLMAANRLADIHVKLEKVCRQLREGRLDARLDLSGTESLEPLERAFNRMADSLNISGSDGAPQARQSN